MMVTHELYLLGGNIKNHIWKLICYINNGGDLIDDANFRFIDESNDTYYGLWGKEKNEDVVIKNGSNSLHIEQNLRGDKKLMQWTEGDRGYRWDTDSGRNAVSKRWRRIWPRKKKSKFKKMKLCGGESRDGNPWRTILKIRDDGEKTYSYFEF